MACKSRKITLSGKNAFKAAFAGRKFATPDLVFYYAPNNMDFGRLGLVTARKAYAGAVVRNRLKRRLRSLFRRLAETARGYDVIIVARRGRTEPDFETLERQMEKLAIALGKR